MNDKQKRWLAAHPDPVKVSRLARALNCSPITAQVLYNRGYQSPGAARAFLRGEGVDWHPPTELTDLDRLLNLIHQAKQEDAPVMVYGDYDADGVTATAIMVGALKAYGLQADYYIPDRFNEGYGIHAPALAAIASQGYKYIITVDCGITAIDEAGQAKALGLKLAITDHHEPGPELPEAEAVVNPKRADCSYPNPHLAGAGLAFKVAQALLGDEARHFADLAAIGTICDVVPLVGENRLLALTGLRQLEESRWPGLRALMQVCRQPNGELTSDWVGFNIGPRLNALGRLDHAKKGVELLLSQDEAEASALAQHLDKVNKERQELSSRLMDEALAHVYADFDPKRDRVIVSAGKNWHQGVLGIVANRVAETFYRPTILLSIEDGEAKGSARSIPGFHLHRALTHCQGLLSRFGGHEGAAGLTLSAEAIPELRAHLNQLANDWLDEEDLLPQLYLDAWVRLGEITPQVAEELGQLGPFGAANPEPVLGAWGCSVPGARPVGNGNHLKLRVKPHGLPGPVHDAIGFNLVPTLPEGTLEGQVQVAFTPELNEFRQQIRLQLKVNALAACEANSDQLGLEELLAWDPLGGTPGRALPLTAAPDLDELHGPVLIVVPTPWQIAQEVAKIRAVWPHLRREVGGGPSHRIRVVALGTAGSPEATVLMKAAPLSLPEGRVSQVAQPDWAEAEAVLAWPYPGREELAELYRVLRPGQRPQLFSLAAIASQLAARLQEPTGPWNELRALRGLEIFQEIGLVRYNKRLEVEVGPAPTGLLDLEASDRYRRGQAARAALAALKEASNRPHVSTIEY